MSILGSPDIPPIALVIGAIVAVVVLAAMGVVAAIVRTRRAGARRSGRQSDQPIRMSELATADETPVLARALGSGRHGQVYELADQPRVVQKILLRPWPHAARAFDRLASFGDTVRDALADQPIDLAWPSRATGDGDEVTGYLMPRIAADYYLAAVGKAVPRLRQLQLVEPDPGLPSPASDAERVELVRLVGRFLAAMHAKGLVYGDISWTNFAFTLADGVRLSVHDFDSTRALGTTPVSHDRPGDSEGWADPGLHETPMAATLDADRFKFALLAYRILVSRDRTSLIDPDCSIAIDTLTTTQHVRLTALWRRAAGPAGTRPQISEWLPALTTGSESARRPTPAAA